MIEICSVEKCTGCSSCYNSCPKSAITMTANVEGFLYPHIDQGTCIDCGLCQSRCPVSNPVDKHSVGSVFAFISNNDEMIWKSASGGAFYELAAVVLATGGIVYGARYDSNLYVCHERVDNLKNVEPLLSTKYVQSDLNTVYAQAKTDLDRGRKVLFSGTGCQIAGLYSFLKGDNANLVTVDLLCKGVPSPGLFKKYIAYLSEKLGEGLVSFDFRSKKYGWGYLTTTTTTSGKHYVLKRTGGSFVRTAGHGYVRKACFSCPYTSEERISDLTLGDFWHIGEVDKINVDVKRGCSSVICNTQKGRDLLDSIKNAYVVERSMEELKRGQSSSLSHPIKEPKTRTDFFNDAVKMNYSDLAKKYLTDTSLKGRMQDYMPMFLQNIIRKALK